MTTPDPLLARQFARQIVESLRSAGFQALWAGGCVRDQLLEHLPKDYDVATNATPEQIREVFGRRRTLAIGAAFGVVSVRGPKGAGHVEVATFRQDSQYSDGRHPDRVTFSTPQADAQRRDFTINGIFYDPLAEQVIDYVGGAEDLRRGIVRAIGDPHARFAEDKLRLLRAVRFAATFAFRLEEQTLAAIRQHAQEITVVSSERIAAELRRMLIHPHRAEAVRLLRMSGLLTEILPEATLIFADDEKVESTVGEQPSLLAPDSGPWQRTLSVLIELQEPSFAVALAALLREIQEPNRPQGEMLEEICRRWRLSRDEMQRTTWLIAHESSLRHADQLPWPVVQRLLTADGGKELLQLAEAIVRSLYLERHGIDLCRSRMALPPEQFDPPPLLSGNDLLSAGMPRGKAYKQILDEVRDAQLEGRIATKDQALELARTIWNSLAPKGA